MIGFRRRRPCRKRGEKVKTLASAVICALLSPTFIFAAPAGPAPAGKTAKLAKPAAALQTDEQKTLYVLGIWLAQKVDVFSLSAADLKYVQLGVKDAVLNQKPQVEPAVYGPKINDLAQSRIKARAEKEKRKSQAFMDKTAKEAGAQKTASGLIYFEVKAGTGAAPGATDTVKAYYKGTLVDGSVFDASAKHGAGPMEFTLNAVIPCWTEGIQKMKVGGKAELVCPSDIAYGDRGTGGIPGGAALVFEVELAEVVKKEPVQDPKEFLDKSAKEAGAKAFPSGLIYKEIKAGTGASPKAADTVKVHYTGTFPDGKVFDSSVQRGQPTEFPLGGVIPCWTEGIQKMKVGGKAKLICPASIAYGDEGRPGIPGGATLVFEVELLDIVKK
ncbi:MAG: FKBP-type peptidyl-prolyl cis-trans isomerase [Elusimicrobia bacterium]|nr:FKBP-type peptidyl-prolyl cis-trans isomerase [Elusimicrobiota bacterium]